MIPLNPFVFFLPPRLHHCFYKRFKAETRVTGLKRDGTKHGDGRYPPSGNDHRGGMACDQMAYWVKWVPFPWGGMGWNRVADPWQELGRRVMVYQASRRLWYVRLAWSRMGASPPISGVSSSRLANGRLSVRHMSSHLLNAETCVG
jgi:hypothetical protein